jgi:hypothetical protein
MKIPSDRFFNKISISIISARWRDGLDLAGRLRFERSAFGKDNPFADFYGSVLGTYVPSGFTITKWGD